MNMLAYAAVLSLLLTETSAWYVRGTNNEGIPEKLLPSAVQPGFLCRVIVFEGGDANGPSRFRISRFADNFDEAYPEEEKQPPRPYGAYNLCFHPDTKEITFRDFGNPAWWYFRGTPNRFNATRMAQVPDTTTWCSTQTFEAEHETPPRFKIAKFARHYDLSYPASDYLVNDGFGSYKICFDDSTNTISLTKLDMNAWFKCDQGVTYPGQSVYVVGNRPELGNWDPEHAVKLSTNTDKAAYPAWEGTVRLPVFTDVEWKCLKREELDHTKGVEWQSGSNNAFNTGGTDFNAHAGF